MVERGISEFYIYGGKGSSKTITINQYIARAVLSRNENAIIFRKENSTIKATLKNSLKKSIESCRLKEAFDILEFTARSKVNVAEIVMKGIDNEDKVKGIEGFSYLYHDELDQFTKEDYRESINAFRGEVAEVYFGAWNPTDINSFIKTEIIDPDAWVECDLKLPSKGSFVKINSKGNRALIKTLYSDNYYMVGSPCGAYGFVDQKTIDRYEQMKFVDEHWYNVNVLGEWGVIKPDDPFFTRFERTKHLSKDLQVNNALPIALSFDFNVRNSCIAGQFNLHTKRVRILKEWRLHGIDLIDLVMTIIDYYGANRTYIITGDSSGNNRSALTTGNIGAFDTIKTFLDRLGVNYSFQVPKANLMHINSKMINNAILYMEHDYLIDENECTELISDLERMRTGKDGGLNKVHADKNNYGHLGDCFRYFNDVLLIEMYESYDIVKYKQDDTVRRIVHNTNFIDELLNKSPYSP